MAMNVKATVSMRDGKLNLLLEPDARCDPPDASVLDEKIDIREVIKGKITNGQIALRVPEKYDAQGANCYDLPCSGQPPV